MSETKDNRTATQRIEDLERVVTMLYQNAQKMGPAVEHLMKIQGDMGMMLDALKLLNKKTEAIIQVADPVTGISTQSVSELVVKMNVADLKAQVEGFVAQGHLVATDTVAKDSYLVCEEWNAEGVLVNPRVQFRLDSQQPETADLLVGKASGDMVSFGENKLNAKIMEIYSIVEPKAPDAAPTEPAPAAEAAPLETPPSEALPPAATTPTLRVLDPLPLETPVTEFVPNDPSTMMTTSN